MCQFIKVVTSSRMSEPWGTLIFPGGRRKDGLTMDADRVQNWLMRSVEVEPRLASRKRKTVAWWEVKKELRAG